MIKRSEQISPFTLNKVFSREGIAFNAALHNLVAQPDSFSFQYTRLHDQLYQRLPKELLVFESSVRDFIDKQVKKMFFERKKSSNLDMKSVELPEAFFEVALIAAKVTVAEEVGSLEYFEMCSSFAAHFNLSKTTIATLENSGIKYTVDQLNDQFTRDYRDQLQEQLNRNKQKLKAGKSNKDRANASV